MSETERDRRVLLSLAPDLRRKVLAVLGDVNCKPLPKGYCLRPWQGFRSPEEQEACFRAGTSQLRRGKHNVMPALACDLVWWHPVKGWSWAGSMPWGLVGRAAAAHGLAWGGSWRRFVDRPHVELRG